ncbi:MAG: hypothetical protein QG622_2860 [Actinomycetota bacterium]|nr:hypothetical protein [Actinomycetota bacterium]
MQVRFDNVNDQVIFRLLDVDPRFHDVLRQCFWATDGDSWFRPYPADARHLDRIRPYFAAQAERMFSQLGYFEPVPWERALLAFADRAAGTTIDWWLTGSCAACIRGVPLNPHDVDIIIDSGSADEVAGRFADVLIEPIVDTGGWLTKEFGVLFWHARIDIASDPVAALDDPEPSDCGPYARAHLEEVTWQGRTFRVPPLELQASINQRRGRSDRASLIQAHLAAAEQDPHEGSGTA